MIVRRCKKKCSSSVSPRSGRKNQPPFVLFQHPKSGDSLSLLPITQRSFFLLLYSAVQFRSFQGCSSHPHPLPLPAGRRASHRPPPSDPLRSTPFKADLFLTTTGQRWRKTEMRLFTFSAPHYPSSPGLPPPKKKCVCTTLRPPSSFFWAGIYIGARVTSPFSLVIIVISFLALSPSGRPHFWSPVAEASTRRGRGEEAVPCEQ